MKSECEKKAWTKPEVVKLGALRNVAGPVGGTVNDGSATNRIS